MKLYNIGIDPGKDTGLAVWNGNLGQFVELIATDFVGAIDMCLEYKNNVEKVFVEVPPTKFNWHDPAAAHNVGRVCREAELMVEMLKYYEFQVISVPPQGKIDDDQFRKLTEYPHKTNQHKRDAAMLVWGTWGEI